MITYLVFPFTVTTIFDTFKCEEFHLGTGEVRKFLMKDLSLDCEARILCQIIRSFRSFFFFFAGR